MKRFTSAGNAQRFFTQITEELLDQRRMVTSRTRSTIARLTATAAFLSICEMATRLASQSTRSSGYIASA